MLGIPYRVIGGPRFFERAEIRDAMAYLRLIRSEDDDLAFERVVNQPKRGVGAKAFQTLQQQAANPPKRVRGYDEDLAIDVDTGEILTDLFDESPGPQRITLFEAARYVISEKQVSKGALTGLKTFIDQIKFWKERAKSGMSHTELAEQILDESGYTDMLRADRSPQAATRLDNLKELVAAMGQFDSLNAFLEHVELVMDTTRDSGNEDEVQILTLHAAKGLEWPLVFLPGWEEEVFPSKRSVDENGNKGLEEERRLAYVGITRARESCRISFVANRMIYGRWTSVIPSRFIDELPHENVEAISETGYGSRQGFSENFASAETSFEDLGQSSTYSSPGWKRMRETTRKRSAPPTIDGKAELLASSDPGRADFNIGQRVFHIKFGYGKVEQIEGAKLTVDFEKAGTKKVIGTFLEAA